MIWLEDSSIGVLPAVVELARRAAEREPENAPAWQRLGETQLLAGASTKAITSFSRALGLMPDSGELQLQLAGIYGRAGDFESAIQLVERYLLGRPENTAARIKRFELLVNAEKWEAARLQAKEVESLDPANVALVSLAAKQASEDNRWHELLRTCDIALAAFPAHTSARYYRAIALASLGRAEAAASMNLSRFLSVRDLAPSLDFPDSMAFHAALTAEILGNPTLTPDPHGRATRNGFQTKQLEQPDSIMVRALLGLIRNAIDEYVRHLETCDDPFTLSCPRKARLNSWAVVYTSQGRQIPHIHPRGWLSGVYYVAAPLIPEGAREGTLTLGPASDNDPAAPPWGTKTIAPVPGRVVLFPSWTPHATEATHSYEQRISVAFDVVPVEG